MFSFYRTYKSQKVLVAVNLSNETQIATFEKDFGKCNTLFGKSKIENKALQLNPYEVAVFEIK
jgi:hypothetical protein